MDSQTDTGRSKLRSASAAQGSSEIHRRPAVRSANSGNNYDTSSIHRSLPRRKQTVLPPSRLQRNRRRVVIREQIRQLSALSTQPSAKSWRLLLLVAFDCVGTGTPARPSRAKLGRV